MKKIVFFVFFMLLSFVVYAAPTRLTHIRVSDTNGAVRVIFQLTDATKYKVFTLEHPDRLVVDFANTKLAYRLHALSVPGVNTVRSGRPQLTTLRLVFELMSPVRPVYFYEPQKNQLVLDFSNTKRSSELSSTVEKKPVMQATAHAKTVVIVVDPGHGGKDVGAVGENGTQEKNVVLGISRKLAHLINAQPNMRAELTRDGDYFVPLRGRLKLARKGKADLFVAIHADSYFNNSASGASVYALSHHGATSEAARWLAKRDNYSELGGVDLDELGNQSYMLRSVLIDLSQTATITDSLRLGTSILDALEDVTRLHYTRVEQAPFMVLKSPDIPSVLVETGFISNTREEARLRSDEYQMQIAKSLLTGIRAYLKKYPPGL